MASEWDPRDDPLVRTSTLVIAAGAGLFVLPIPGTFIGGALVALAGAAARVFGF